jgi:hypothetical protein
MNTTTTKQEKVKLYALKDSWHLAKQMSHLSVQTKLDNNLTAVLLRSETSTTLESSIDE